VALDLRLAEPRLTGNLPARHSVNVSKSQAGAVNRLEPPVLEQLGFESGPNGTSLLPPVLAVLLLGRSPPPVVEDLVLGHREQPRWQSVFVNGLAVAIESRNVSLVTSSATARLPARLAAYRNREAA
jgi:hypothetical protein